MRANVLGERALWLIVAFWLVLVCIGLLAGCRTPPAPPVDVDKLNAQSQAELQAQADREKDKSIERVIKDLRRENLEKLRNLK